MKNRNMNILSILYLLYKSKESYIIIDDIDKIIIPDNFIMNDNKMLINDFVINSNHLNFNIGVKIEGKVKIDNRLIDTFIHKNIPIVVDGNIKNSNIKLEVSPTIKNIIKNKLLNIYPQNREMLEKLYNGTLDISNLDLFDYNYYLQYNVKQIIDMRLDILYSETVNKVLNYILPKREVENKYFNSDGSLKYFTESKTNSKKYREIFTIDIKGFKLLPSVKSVLEKFNNGKKLSQREDFIFNIYNTLKDIDVNSLQDTFKHNKKILKMLKNNYLLARSVRELLDKPLNGIDENSGSIFNEKLKVNNKKYDIVVKVNPLTGSFRQKDVIDLSI